MGNYRNRKLTDLARGRPCMARLPGCTGGGDDAIWAHSNHQRHGKGGSLKAHDCYGAILCYACHYAIDEGPGSRDEKEWAMQQARDITLLYLWRHGLIEVAE